MEFDLVMFINFCEKYSNVTRHFESLTGCSFILYIFHQKDKKSDWVLGRRVRRFSPMGSGILTDFGNETSKIRIYPVRASNQYIMPIFCLEIYKYQQLKLYGLTTSFISQLMLRMVKRLKLVMRLEANKFNTDINSTKIE